MERILKLIMVIALFTFDIILLCLVLESLKNSKVTIMIWRRMYVWDCASKLHPIPRPSDSRRSWPSIGSICSEIVFLWGKTRWGTSHFDFRVVWLVPQPRPRGRNEITGLSASQLARRDQCSLGRLGKESAWQDNLTNMLFLLLTFQSFYLYSIRICNKFCILPSNSFLNSDPSQKNVSWQLKLFP